MPELSTDVFNALPSKAPEPEREPGWLTVAEAAEVLGVSESTVRRRAGNNELRSRRASLDDPLEVYVEEQQA